MRWPTQLTDHGLKVIRDNLQPGQVAILFRNDHFSTLCKNPRNGELVTLVTDQGYSTHDEIVWESLTDVNGQGSQLFSGDFRSVDNSNPSGPQDQHQPSSVDNGQGWTTVPARRGNAQSTIPQDTSVTSPEALSRAEQEDHDLALALQLQEEEEDRERRETEQRNSRNNQLSMDAINAPPQPPRNPQNPVIPPRRNNNITGHRPAGEAAPPPLYEEAITSPQYVPPAGHPASAQAPVPGQGGSGSAYQSTSGGLPALPGAGRGRHGNVLPGRMGGGRRPSQGQQGQGQEERDKCVVM